MKRIAIALAILLAGCATSSEHVAITGATVVDGSGAPGRVATVVVRGDTIVSVGEPAPWGARRIDAAGLVLAPGFIDIHNHSSSGLEREPEAATQVSQGITTVVLGQDGSSDLSVLDRPPASVNILTFVGHSTLRRELDADVTQMAKSVAAAMRAGAFGLSTGLEYETAKPATTDEVIALAREAAACGGIYMTHIRDEAQKTLESIEEAIRIGETAGLPVQISHIKMGSVSVWGKAGEAVRIVDEARRRGVDVTADIYPYDAWHATIRVLVPSGRHDDPAEVAAAIAETGGADRVTIVRCEAHPAYEFKTLQQIAEQEGMTPVEVYMQVVRDGGATVVGRSMREDDMRVFFAQPWVMIGSDGGIGVRHPRGAGAYPRILGRLVREQRWLTLEEAVRKMTSMPAARLGIRDRGLVRAGMKADLVLFNPARIIDHATFQEPGKISEGVEGVFVNGVEVWRGGAVTGARPGVAIRHSCSSHTR